MSSSEPGQGPSILKSTLKVAGPLAILFYATSVWLAGSGLDRHTGTLLAEAAGLEDGPVTTGSLGRSAGAARLDPCAAPR